MRLIYYISILALVLSACSKGKAWEQNKVDQLLNSKTLTPKTEIVLADMDYDEYRNTFKHTYDILSVNDKGDYFKFKTVTDNNVTEGFYALHETNLGMSIGRLDKDGKKSTMIAPPGFDYVIGNPKYGKFEEKAGRRLWVFYPSYFYYRSLFYYGSRPIYYSGYNTYRNSYRNNRHYYGGTSSSRNWGTNSTGTKTTHKNYHSRSKARNSSWKRNFSNSSRSRGGGGFGK